MAHTPGPWRHVQDGDEPYWSIGMNGTNPISGQAMVYTTEEDARLIAEAPELLRLLREGSSVVSSLEADCDEAGIDSQRARWWWQSVDKLFDKLEVD